MYYEVNKSGTWNIFAFLRIQLQVWCAQVQNSCQLLLTETRKKWKWNKNIPEVIPIACLSTAGLELDFVTGWAAMCPVCGELRLLLWLGGGGAGAGDEGAGGGSGFSLVDDASSSSSLDDELCTRRLYWQITFRSLWIVFKTSINTPLLDVCLHLG